MAALRFWYGTMSSGKSTVALQIHHNLGLRGHRGLLCTQLDRQGARVSSRLGVSEPAVEVAPAMDLFDLAGRFAKAEGRLDHLVCDEVQFYEVDQVEQLARIVDDLGADVYAFGLLLDFRGRLFPATARLLELADERIEIQVEVRCWCGAPATHNARVVDGRQVYEGDTVVMGDVGAQGEVPLWGDRVTYEVVCRRHWQAGEPIGPGPGAGTSGRDREEPSPDP
ncbi:MAG: thymidine kinase [Acidimicrobiia bacterium]